MKQCDLRWPPARPLSRRAYSLLHPTIPVIAALIAISVSAPASALEAVDLLPAEVGTRWTFLSDGVLVDQEVTGTEEIDGLTTLVVETISGPQTGTVGYSSNAGNGLLLHGLSTAEEPAGLILLYPPALQLPANFVAPSNHSSAGQIEVILTGLGVFDGTYAMDNSVIGFEVVAVPAGTYSALRVDFDFVLTAVVGQMEITSRVSGSDWFASGVGIVKSTGIADGVSFTSVLVSSNVPEPSSTLAAASTLIALAGLAARRRRGRDSRRARNGTL